MMITVGERTIEAQVMENQKAQDKYDDAIAAGNAAALMKESKENADLYQIHIGNILPGQTAKVEIHLIQPLTIQACAYNFVLPLSYFPKYYADSDEDEPNPIASGEPEQMVSSLNDA